MKLLKALILVYFISALPIYAQKRIENAMGVRVGANNGLRVELSYQHYLSEAHHRRLEFGFGYEDVDNFETIKLIGMYQYVAKLTGNYNWYAGVGGGLAAFKTEILDDEVVLASGVVGIEYNPTYMPLLFSLDFRPEYGFNSNYSDAIDFDIGLSIRIQF